MITKKICNCSRRSNGRYSAVILKNWRKKTRPIDSKGNSKSCSSMSDAKCSRGLIAACQFPFYGWLSVSRYFWRYATVLAPKNSCGLKWYSCFAFTALHKVLYGSHFETFLPNAWQQHLSEAVEEDSVNPFLLYSSCHLHGRHWHVWLPTSNEPWTLFKDTIEHTCNRFCSLVLSTLGKFLRDFPLASLKLNWVVYFPEVTLPLFFSNGFGSS